jgi:general stress protein CsbA
MSPLIIRWLPRVVAILFTLFISLFALDVSEGGPVKMLDLLMHLLPTFFCVLIILLAWRREWLGALIFLALAAVYAWWAREHMQWILLIGGPMLLLAGLYLAAWMQRKRSSAT